MRYYLAAQALRFSDMNLKLLTKGSMLPHCTHMIGPPFAFFNRLIRLPILLTNLAITSEGIYAHVSLIAAAIPSDCFWTPLHIHTVPHKNWGLAK